jgi:alginate O-acetyltransferase complex protein AlgI
MLFNSLEFMIFFPVVTALFFALPHRFRWLLLLVASYVFYVAWSPLYLLLLLGSSVLDWYVAMRLEDEPDVARRRRWLLVSLAGNLGILFSFKYYNLVNDSFGAVAGWFGVDWPVPRSTFALPVGISFYTFQSLSYTIDVFRGELRAERKPLMFLLYVAYFPQLVAGPIERAGKLLPQLYVPYRFDWQRTVSGLRIACWGMFKKVVVADRLAEVVNIIMADVPSFGAFAHVLAVVFFGIQVYLDFSGYSDIAVGTARILGVDLMRNFDQPYLSRSMAELWSRWHISMTTWFRDYVYMPLGGSRVSTSRWAFNVSVVFVGSGLWHGAQWTLVIWGALHAVILIAERLTSPARTRLQEALGLPRVPWLQAILQWMCVLVVWNFTVLFFRTPSLPDAVYVLTHLHQGWGPLYSPALLAAFLSRVHLDHGLFLYCLLLVPLTEFVEYCFRSEPIRAYMHHSVPAPVRWLLDWSLVASILVFGNFGDVPFVYFQF